MSGIDKIIKDLGLEKLDRFSKPQQTKKTWSKVVNQVPRQQDVSVMIDLLELPKTRQGYRYLLVAVDLWSREVDFEPLSTKISTAVRDALKKIFRRGIVGPMKAPAQLSTDGGREFEGAFDKWLDEKNIYHKRSLPYRHTQQSVVERMNRTLGRLLNLYMSKKQIESGETYREWAELLPYLRTKMNDPIIRKLREDEDVFEEKPPALDPMRKPKFSVGDLVHRQLDYPEDVFGKKQPTENFRAGDMRYEREPREIVDVFPYPPPVHFRFQLDGLENVSYPAWQLMESDLDEKMYRVKQLIGRKTVKNELFYLVWWEGEKKSQATWEPKSNLVIDPVLEKAVELYDRQHPLRAPPKSKKRNRSKKEQKQPSRRSERLRNRS